MSDSFTVRCNSACSYTAIKKYLYSFQSATLSRVMFDSTTIEQQWSATIEQHWSATVEQLRDIIIDFDANIFCQRLDNKKILDEF